MTAVRLRIRGRVQGVWYRGWSIERADAWGLDGWVRNRADGTVEMALSGPADAVNGMIAECRRGPPAAEVDDVEVADEPGQVDSGFRRLPTA